MISDICSDTYQQLDQYLKNMSEVYGDMEPRIRLLMADLKALQAELDHVPSNDTPAPRFDPITPRLLALRDRINANPANNLTEEQWSKVTPVFSSAEALLEDLQNLDFDIWEDPKD